MRLIYVDESGTSIHSPVLIVAGVIIDADRQWKTVERHMAAIADEYVSRSRGPAGMPELLRQEFFLHAADMFHGSDEFDRRIYPIKHAHSALERLLAVPSMFRIPVVYGYVRKFDADFHLISKRSDRAKAIRSAIESHHSSAFTLCAVAAERFMRSIHVGSAEIALLTAENNEPTRRHVKVMHDLLRGSVTKRQELQSLSGDLECELPITKIVDAVHFAEKRDACLLQLADACAFVIRRMIEENMPMEFIRSFWPRADQGLTTWVKRHAGKGGGYAQFDF